MINYLLQAFGYANGHDLITSTFKVAFYGNIKMWITLSVTLGTIREFIEMSMGLDIAVLLCFVLLIIFEWHTGILVDVRVRKKKFQSRKFGRMLMKIGIYLTILLMLSTLSSRTASLDFVGFDLNPLQWLYYIVFVAIIIQLLISWLENLAALGYKEAGGLVGIIMRKSDKWFEFDEGYDGDNQYGNYNPRSKRRKRNKIEEDEID